MSSGWFYCDARNDVRKLDYLWWYFEQVVTYVPKKRKKEGWESFAFHYYYFLNVA